MYIPLVNEATEQQLTEELADLYLAPTPVSKGYLNPRHTGKVLMGYMADGQVCFTFFSEINNMMDVTKLKDVIRAIKSPNTCIELTVPVKRHIMKTYPLLWEVLDVKLDQQEVEYAARANSIGRGSKRPNFQTWN